MERFLGITTERDLPAFAEQSFTSWFEERETPGGEHPMGKAALFYDTFSNYNFPEIAIAATKLLEAAGFEVVVPDHGDDGRPLISKGMVEEARRTALNTIECLEPLVEESVPIVGIEPSSLLSLRDEYLYLLPDDERVAKLAELALTFEEFIAMLADEGRLTLKFTEASRQILLHGHCHQKSLVGMEPSKRALSLPPNYSVTEVDSGCCGMAGSFGYEVEHYEISMKMAERRLLPAVREADDGTLIVAAGVSCRQQILHGSGREALHPAQVLLEALAD